MERVVVVGGGISGLAVAAQLLEEAKSLGRNVHITVLEAESRPGGKMWTELAEGFVVEHGPNGFLDSKVEALALAHNVGLSEQLLRASEHSKKRYIVRKGRLMRLPETPVAFLTTPLLSLRGKLTVLSEPLAPPAPEGVDETLADFAVRRLGIEALDYLIDPMVSGIFAGDPKRLSLASAFPRIHEIERIYGGLFRGLLALSMRHKRRAGPAGPGGTLTSFKRGVRALVETLAARLGSSLVLDARVTGLKRSSIGWSVETMTKGEKRVLPADAVVLSCPAYEAARLLGRESPSASEQLMSIHYAPVTVVATAFRQEDCGNLDGFGFVIPRREGRPILGTLWDSSIFENRAPKGYALLRTMVGGARSEGHAALPDKEIVEMVCTQLRELMGIKATPERVWIWRHERGIPQYEVGHQERLFLIDKGLKRVPGVFLCHNAYRGIALSDCAREAQATAKLVVSYLFPWGGI